MAAKEDAVDDLIRKYLVKKFKYIEIRLSIERNHEFVVSIAIILNRKFKQLDLRRRMPFYDIDAIRRTITQMLDGPKSNLGYRSVCVCRMKKAAVNTISEGRDLSCYFSK